MISGEVLSELRIPFRFLKTVVNDINSGITSGEWTFETDSGYKYIFTKPSHVLSVDVRKEAL